MGRHKNTALRRAQIVEGLLTVMATEGYSGASIQTIARTAELSPGLLHYHFGSKQDILIALLDTLAQRLHERYSALLPKADTPWAAVEAWIDAHLALGDAADPRAVACWVQIGAEALCQPEVQHRYAQILQEDSDVLLRALRAADIPEPERAAAGIVAAVQGAYQLSMAAPSVTPQGTAAGVVRQMAAAFRP
ncbi:MAG: TetR/AcrR family bet gene transcriptional repressor [Myxococcota bacterium]|jgi:TetR/AcrR family transcriptional repressor of bet genes